MLSSGTEAKLVVNVAQVALEEENHNAAPVKVVSKEGREGSFGFTTEKQGEFRFCFHNEAPGVDHELEIDFKLKVWNSWQHLFSFLHEKKKKKIRLVMRPRITKRWPRSST